MASRAEVLTRTGFCERMYTYINAKSQNPEKSAKKTNNTDRLGMVGTTIFVTGFAKLQCR